MTVSVFIQSYPPPTELPAMRAGETDGRYMDCSPALAPVGDVFVDASTITLCVRRVDGKPMTADDLQQAPSAFPPTLDAAGRTFTTGWTAPAGAAGVTYYISLRASPTKEGRTFVRDWMMSVLPLMG